MTLFDPKKYGATPVATSTFNPAAFGAKPVAAAPTQPGLLQNIWSDLTARGQGNVNIYNQATSKGDTTLSNSLAGGAKLVANTLGGITDVASRLAHTNRLTGALFDLPGEVIGGGVNAASDALSNTKLFQDAAKYPAQTKTTENVLSSLASFGEIANNILLAEGARSTAVNTPAVVKSAFDTVKGKLPELPSSPFSSKPDAVVANNLKGLQKLEDNNAPIRKVVAKHTQRGIDSKNLLAQSDLLLNAVDDTGTLRTTNARTELTDFIKPYESVVSDNLAREGVKIPLKTVESHLRNAVDNSGLEGAALDAAHTKVDAEIRGLTRRASNGDISLSKIQDAKINKYATVDYLNEGSKIADKAIAKSLKDIVENNTLSVDVKALNRELSQHYSVLDLLEKLDGKKVEGGKLGKYFAQTVGSIVGSHFGPLGAIAGAEIGGRIKGAMLSSKFSKETGNKLTTSDAMNAAVEKAKTPRDLPALIPGNDYTPASGGQKYAPIPLKGPATIEPPAQSIYSNSLGNRQTTQTITTTATKKAIPKDSTSGKAANGDKKPASAKTGAWPTTASKPSKDGVTSTGNAPTGKGGVSARKADTSGPFDRATFIKSVTEKPQLKGHVFHNLPEGVLQKIANNGELTEGSFANIPVFTGQDYWLAAKPADLKITKTSKYGETDFGPIQELRAGNSKLNPDTTLVVDTKGNVRLLRDFSPPSIPKELEPLAAEARKYKTKEEFYQKVIAERGASDYSFKEFGLKWKNGELTSEAFKAFTKDGSFHTFFNRVKGKQK